MRSRRLLLPWFRCICRPVVAGLIAGFLSLASIARADEPRDESPAARGYRWLTTKPFLPADFDDEIFESLWTVWPAEQRDAARQATPAERRRLTFSHYGLMESPDHPGSGPALGYVSDGKGGWVMNCLACHGGQVAGRLIPGVGNSNFLLETLTEDVRLLKLQTGKALTHLDLGSLKMPLGGSRGTTNSVVFGVALGALRDKDLNMRRDIPPPKLVHHDEDAPAFWNVRRKKRIYSDGFAVKSHRPLVQFVMLPRNSGSTLRGWEPEFRDILAWIESLAAPRYPWEIDQTLAAAGKVAFERTCARCHGTYGDNGTYPERIVPIDELGTDPFRLQSLSVEYRRNMRQSWFGDYGREAYIDDPGGYVAPPLDGVWATAPYLHNGSVPTLWHLLHPAERPKVWQRTAAGYDQSRVGLEVTEFDQLPATAKTPASKREFFNSQLSGKSAAGHNFPDDLTEDEKRAVLEYLKTL